MNGIRKFIGLAAIAAVLNPLCCCIAGVVAKAGPANAPLHSCCTSQKEAPSPENAPAGGCASEEGCAHKQGAYEREAPAHVHGLVVAPVAQAVSQFGVESLQLVAAISPAWELAEQGPPGQIDPPAWLRSHSFLN